MELNRHGLNEVALNTIPASGGNRVVAQVDAPFSLRLLLTVEHETPFDIGPRTRQQHDALWGLRILVHHDAPFGNRIAPASHAAEFTLVASVQVGHQALLDLQLTEAVRAQHEASWATRIIVQHETSWHVFTGVAAQHEAPWAQSVPVAAEHQAPVDLLAFVPVAAQHRTSFDAEASSVINISGNPHVEMGGRQIAISGADLAFDEGGFAWTSSIELAQVGDYQVFRRNDPFTVVLFGDRYEFIVDSKSLSRDRPAGVSMVISGVSPVAMLDSGPDRAAEITKTWTAPVNASDVVRELAGNIPVDWQIIDWLIPAHRLGVSNASPIGVIQQVAQAAGGVAEAKQDGSLLIRPAFPVSVPNWGREPSDHVFTDAADNLSVREGVVAAAVFDRFYLTDAAATTSSDRIEWTPEEGDAHRGRLLVYPGNWRTNLAVTSTRSGVVLGPVGIVTREEEETIEIRQGTGNTQYPIDAILETEWLDRNLGGVSAAPYTNEITAAGAGGYSLLRIRYRTKAIVYNAEYAAEGMAQFLVEEL
ncbi:hypothetical protein [Stutzerimonas nitrititolerans]|uniref:hypothetical protein n=1 Tax=Stutzerimonas nitrititolerans TaxID=2482751 RepID=UPI0028A1A70F|nr:hypothetical protein [Stutzerimonas nitrititolerans]